MLTVSPFNHTIHTGRYFEAVGNSTLNRFDFEYFLDSSSLHALPVAYLYRKRATLVPEKACRGQYALRSAHFTRSTSFAGRRRDFILGASGPGAAFHHAVAPFPPPGPYFVVQTTRLAAMDLEAFFVELGDFAQGGAAEEYEGQRASSAGDGDRRDSEWSALDGLVAMLHDQTAKLCS